MPKAILSSKSATLKGRKRKNKDVESDTASELKRVKCESPKSCLKPNKDDDVEQKKVVSNYLPEKAKKHYKIISNLMNEFNCNSLDMKIYCREYEKTQIKEYIQNNYKESKSGCMYVCGHPGTGKSSIIRVILKELDKQMEEDSEFRNSFTIFNYNGMIFKKLYDFSTELIKDIRSKLFGKSSKNLESQLKQTDDVLDLGNRIQKMFLTKQHIHKLIIIDEVDNLSMTESSKNFVAFLNSILKTDTNTTIIGIANSVDLLSKVSQYNTKEGELVEEKCCFTPYSERDIVRIVNKKITVFNQKFNWEADYIDKNALEYAAKKVAKISGDIRVIFDLIKSAFVQLVLKYREEAIKKKKEMEGNSEDETLLEESKDENLDSNKDDTATVKPFSVDIENPKITFKMILYLSTTKFGLKSQEIIQKLPSQLILMLKTLVMVFDDKNVGKNYKVQDLYTANLQTLRKLNLKESNMSDFWQGLKTLENYGFINYNEGKNAKVGKVSLKTDIEDIRHGLNSSKVFSK